MADGSLKLVLISDTHEQHLKVQVPDGDVLVHAGDFTYSGDVAAIKDFNEWLGKQPHEFKVVIAGNHELGWSKAKEALLTNATYLHDSGVEIRGVKFWGSPFTPTFGSWAFMLPRGRTLLEKWLTIPEGTDVLITHGPPQGLLDRPTSDGVSCGCADLAIVVEALAPKLHVFGHIHGGTGVREYKGTTYINASVLDEAYRFRGNIPPTFDIPHL